MTKLKQLKKERQVLKQTQKNQKREQKKRQQKQLKVQNLAPPSPNNRSNTEEQPVIFSGIDSYHDVKQYDKSGKSIDENREIKDDTNDNDDDDDDGDIGNLSLLVGNMPNLSRQETFLDEVDNVLDEFINELNVSDREDYINGLRLQCYMNLI